MTQGSGHVVDPGGRPIPGATVTVGHQGYYFFESNRATTAADGSFRLDSLPGGAVEAQATKNEVGRASAKLHVAAGETTTWEASLVASPILRGRVVDETGAPIESADVQVASLDLARRRTAKATTAADGSFTIECERDEPMSLRVSARRGTLPSVELDEVAPGGSPIKVTVPAATLPSAHVRGVLVGLDGAPATRGVAGALARGVRLHPGAARPGQRRGHHGPVPARRVLRFRPGPRAPRACRWAPSTLEAGATLDLGRIVVGESGTLKAQVTGAGGEQVSGWLDVLTPTGWHAAGVPIQDGAGYVVRIAPGDDLVSAQGHGSEDRAMQRATIRADQETRVDLRLFALRSRLTALPEQATGR